MKFPTKGEQIGRLKQVALEAVLESSSSTPLGDGLSYSKVTLFAYQLHTSFLYHNNETQFLLHPTFALIVTARLPFF